jgi:hypothetical protein
VNVGLGLSVGTGDSAAATLSIGSELPVDPSETSAALRSVAEKFERFVARFRLYGTLEQANFRKILILLTDT